MDTSVTTLVQIAILSGLDVVKVMDIVLMDVKTNTGRLQCAKVRRISSIILCPFEICGSKYCFLVDNIILIFTKNVHVLVKNTKLKTWSQIEINFMLILYHRMISFCP